MRKHFLRFVCGLILLSGISTDLLAAPIVPSSLPWDDDRTYCTGGCCIRKRSPEGDPAEAVLAPGAYIDAAAAIITDTSGYKALYQRYEEEDAKHRCATTVWDVFSGTFTAVSAVTAAIAGISAFEFDQSITAIFSAVTGASSIVGKVCGTYGAAQRAASMQAAGLVNALTDQVLAQLDGGTRDAALQAVRARLQSGDGV